MKDQPGRKRLIVSPSPAAESEESEGAEARRSHLMSNARRRCILDEQTKDHTRTTFEDQVSIRCRERGARGGRSAALAAGGAALGAAPPHPGALPRMGAPGAAGPPPAGGTAAAAWQSQRGSAAAAPEATAARGQPATWWQQRRQRQRRRRRGRPAGGTAEARPQEAGSASWHAAGASRCRGPAGYCRGAGASCGAIGRRWRGRCQVRCSGSGNFLEHIFQVCLDHRPVPAMRRRTAEVAGGPAESGQGIKIVNVC